MSAAEALEVARATGIRIEIDGDDLVLEAPTAPPPGVLDLVSRHKAGIVTLLRLADDVWSAEDWQVFFGERAGIAEFDGRLPRPQAESRAFACCVAEWLNRNTMSSPPGRRTGCGCGDHAHALLSHGAESTSYAWLNPRCWPAWHAGRRAEAIAALAAKGIAPPADLAYDFGKNEGA
jgi:hypothetical protein